MECNQLNFCSILLASALYLKTGLGFHLKLELWYVAMIWGSCGVLWWWCGGRSRGERRGRTKSRHHSFFFSFEDRINLVRWVDSCENPDVSMTSLGHSATTRKGQEQDTTTTTWEKPHKAKAEVHPDKGVAIKGGTKEDEIVVTPCRCCRGLFPGHCVGGRWRSRFFLQSWHWKQEAAFEQS